MAKLEYSIENIIAFCILMENNDGIQGKSPDYIIEKFKRYCLPLSEISEDAHKWGLDSMNTLKFHNYRSEWFPKPDINKLVTVTLKKEITDD